MKKGKHPEYQDILFEDSSNGFRFICGSTLKPKETAVYEGKEYPIYRVSVSSASHPFFTGSQQFVDSEGRVDKFHRRYVSRGGSSQGKGVSEKAEEKGSPGVSAKKKK